MIIANQALHFILFISTGNGVVPIIATDRDFHSSQGSIVFNFTQQKHSLNTPESKNNFYNIIIVVCGICFKFSSWSGNGASSVSGTISWFMKPNVLNSTNSLKQSPLVDFLHQWPVQQLAPYINQWPNPGQFPVVITVCTTSFPGIYIFTIAAVIVHGSFRAESCRFFSCPCNAEWLSCSVAELIIIFIAWVVIPAWVLERINRTIGTRIIIAQQVFCINQRSLISGGSGWFNRCLGFIKKYLVEANWEENSHCLWRKLGEKRATRNGKS